jgi:hypothetical protein
LNEENAVADVEKSDADKSADKPADKPAETPAEKPAAKRRSTGAAVKSATSTFRSKLASLVWLIAVVCALILAVGALLVALKANQDNAIVAWILDAADTLDLGVFSREEGIFTFEKDRDGVQSALVNWGLAALAYLVVGKILDRIIRP